MSDLVLGPVRCRLSYERSWARLSVILHRYLIIIPSAALGVGEIAALAGAGAFLISLTSLPGVALHIGKLRARDRRLHSVDVVEQL